MQSKTVLLLRHGKSDWEATFGTDHERPLAARGRRAARRMGEWLRRVGPLPDRVLTSDATRARTTAELATEAGDWGCPVELRPDFYSASSDTLIRALNQLEESVETVVLAGHQPTWGQTTARLAGGGSVRFPTAALACLVFHGPWSSLRAGGCELHWLVTPKLVAKALEG